MLGSRHNQLDQARSHQYYYFRYVHLKKIAILLRHPGIEPGPHRWQRRILTTELMALRLKFFFKYELRELNSGPTACEAVVITN